MGPTRTRTLGMRLSCNFVNVYMIDYRIQYTFTRVHARIPNGHPRENPRVEKRECRTSRRTSRRGSSCVFGSWQAERESRRTRRLPRKSARMSVVSVSVPWNSIFSKHCSRISAAPDTAPAFDVVSNAVVSCAIIACNYFSACYNGALNHGISMVSTCTAVSV